MRVPSSVTFLLVASACLVSCDVASVFEDPPPQPLPEIEYVIQRDYARMKYHLRLASLRAAIARHPQQFGLLSDSTIPRSKDTLRHSFTLSDKSGQGYEIRLWCILTNPPEAGERHKFWPWIRDIGEKENVETSIQYLYNINPARPLDSLRQANYSIRHNDHDFWGYESKNVELRPFLRNEGLVLPDDIEEWERAYDKKFQNFWEVLLSGKSLLLDLDQKSDGTGKAKRKGGRNRN